MSAQAAVAPERERAAGGPRVCDPHFTRFMEREHLQKLDVSWGHERRQRVGRGVLTAPRLGGLGTARPTLRFKESSDAIFGAHRDHGRWGETPSSPALQRIEIRARRSLAPPGSWVATPDQSVPLRTLPACFKPSDYLLVCASWRHEQQNSRHRADLQ